MLACLVIGARGASDIILPTKPTKVAIEITLFQLRNTSTTGGDLLCRIARGHFLSPLGCSKFFDVPGQVLGKYPGATCLHLKTEISLVENHVSAACFA